MSEENLCPVGRQFWTSKHCIVLLEVIFFELLDIVCTSLRKASTPWAECNLSAAENAFHAISQRILRTTFPSLHCILASVRFRGKRQNLILSRKRHIKGGNWLRNKGFKGQLLDFLYTVQDKRLTREYQRGPQLLLYQDNTLERTKKEVRILTQGKIFSFFYKCDVFVQHA